MNVQSLSDKDVITQLRMACFDARRAECQLIELLIEVERRQIHLHEACSSMFDFCRRKLGLSEGAASRRINAARLVARFPSLLGHLASGKTNLSALGVLKEVFDESNVEELIDAAEGKTKRQLEELVVLRAPKPAVPSLLRKMSRRGAKLRPPRFEPLSESTYRLQITASTELRDKIERARDLLRHRIPSGDLAIVIEQAVDALIEKLEKERLGKTKRPHRASRPAKPGVVSRAARREVFERDGEQCAFVGDNGERCPERGFLEIDHVQARARGGSGETTNLRVLCRAHNRLHAEATFGRMHVDAKVRERQQERQSQQERASMPTAFESTA